MNISGSINITGSSGILFSGRAASGFLNTGDKTSEIKEKYDPSNSTDAFSKRLEKLFKQDNAELIRGLEELSEHDKKEIAVESYLQMQGRILNTIKQEETNKKTFLGLEEEKAYYSGLLEDSVNGLTRIEDGKFGFSDTKDGTYVSNSGIEKKIEDVQSRIDKFLYPEGRDENGEPISGSSNTKMTRDFISYATRFQAVTGLSEDCLVMDDSLLLHKLDRNEENYISKADETISSLRQRSNDLHDLMERYRAQFKDDEDDGLNGLSEEAKVLMAAFDFVREQFVQGNTDASLSQLSAMDVKA